MGRHHESGVRAQCKNRIRYIPYLCGKYMKLAKYRVYHEVSYESARLVADSALCSCQPATSPENWTRAALLSLPFFSDI